MKHLSLLLVLVMYVTVCKADLRSWALGLGKGSSGIAVPAPNSANNYGKQYKTCYVDALSPHGHSHASVWFSPECSGSGYWKLQYKTDEGICTMFGDADQSGCPFTSFWTSKAQFVAKNGGNGEEYTDKGVTFIGCENGARVELSRDENRYCAKDAPAENCKTMTSGSILSFLCPNDK
ncbi:hypothetical protein G6F16_008384 [Rhizopus arrhizus]|nr:hypothetical protein G6F24_011508 [Rhizopus arrhizus]KAG0787272.1 hypothetical protein G6F22_007373 [Rhizopus arrhizus]KAG0788320.1 hypothetical protein G6F21_007302 [Rhizopus arrhizus]KAG0810294.1 hypothetical protein G6F20_008082 [Rhizopus arrhizus]KAG0829979.1 hypothetical protein G6F18_008365 [Rhizopus arrhizus]